MSLLDKPLSSENQRFLNKEYRVYDRDTGCHSDFSILQGRKVHFIGERHGSGILIKSQDSWFERFATPADCLYLEGMPPGMLFTSKSLACWPHLPPGMVVRGSDVRNNSDDVDTLLDYRIELQKIGPIQVQKISQIQSLTKGAVELINRALRNNQACCTEEHLFLDPKVLNDVLKIWKHVQALADELDALKTHINNLFSGRLKTKTGANNWFQVKESNLGLAKEIIKFAQDPTIGKIIVLWGFAHFVGKEEIFKALDAQKITYSILLPSYKILKQTDFELGKDQHLHLKARSLDPSDTTQHTIPFPSALLKIFYRSIHPLLTPSDPIKKVWATTQWLQSRTAATIMPHESLCFPNVEFNEEQSDRIQNDNTTVDIRFILSMLEPHFLAAKRRIQLKIDNLNFNTGFDDKSGTEYIKLSPTGAMDVTVQNLIVTTPAALWQHMMRYRLRSYEVPPKTNFIFENVNGDFSKLNDLIFEQFAKALPPGKKSRLTGYLNVWPCKMDGAPVSNAIQLSSDTGFQICLENASPP